LYRKSGKWGVVRRDRGALEDQQAGGEKECTALTTIATATGEKSIKGEKGGGSGTSNLYLHVREKKMERGTVAKTQPVSAHKSFHSTRNLA